MTPYPELVATASPCSLKYCALNLLLLLFCICLWLQNADITNCLSTIYFEGNSVIEILSIWLSVSRISKLILESLFPKYYEAFPVFVLI